MFRRVLVPEFYISPNPTVSLQNVSARRFDMIDRGRICPVCGEKVKDLSAHLSSSSDPEHIVHDVMDS